MAHVAFLWHMHQPYYVDPATHSATMPWVRLHCARSYLDMISLLEDYPGVRANFNLSPALVLQMRELLDGRIRDEWLDLSRKPAAALDDDERFRVLENFFKANWEHLVRPHARYWELLNKRGLTLYRDDVRRGARYFTNQELLDLQVWFNLTWCGFTACRLHPELAELKRKERGFTEAEKQRVLEIHIELMQLTLKRYREAAERGQVELMTSPFFHPILPLLCDTASAERAMPGRPMPRRFAWPEDAQAQLNLAVEQHAAVFGRAPTGLWPAEGSVSPEVVPLMQRAGIEYFCTDEEILFATLRNDPEWRGRSVDHLELFQGWRVKHDGVSVNAVFREQPLSDFIGFSAVKHEPAQAAMHLLFHLRHIGDLVDGRGIVPLMLDGENAWEHFRDGGEAFLRSLYDGLQADGGRLHSTTIADYLRDNPPQRECTALHSGSWIGANFDVWIGEPEENRAWELLGETRTWLERHSATLTAAQLAAARKAMLAAEGSDWFWWYGPDFTTENDPLFDRLFRSHLRAVYEAAGAVPPAALETPVIPRAASALYSTPSRFITPAVNGGRASFFEWSGAGSYDPASRGGALVSRVVFGNDDRHFYLRVDFTRRESVSVDLRFQAPEGVRVSTGLLAVGSSHAASITGDDGTETPAGLAAYAETLELALPLESLGLKPGESVSFQLSVLGEQHPPHSAIEFTLLGDEWALENWVV